MDFGFESTAEEVTQGLDLSGQTWLVTGTNSGLGYETIRVLALRGAKIIAAARTQKKAQKALEELDIDGIPLELPTHTKRLNTPYGGNIWISDMLGAFTMGPLVYVLGWDWGYQIWLIISCTLLGWATQKKGPFAKRSPRSTRNSTGR